ncbi:MAG: hypothetical protein EOO43_09360 [Flavobacterium sp.]|nr:MAG: hypothetical protein EOO43_09360 [Flavobacterium sp.]
MHPLTLLFITGKLTESSNFPLEIWASDRTGHRSRYYVKSFRKQKINTFQTAKEIVACEVALQLDLPTPKYDVIDIAPAKLSGFYSDNEVQRFYDGHKFCSKRLEQYNALPRISTGYLRDYEVAGIFAFDVLMQNADRGVRDGKPNLLINDDSLIMIDHELTLSFISSMPSTVDYENNIRLYPYYYHVLLNHVKSIKVKSHIFDEFLENLRLLNIESLNSVFDEMDKYNIEYGDRLDYFAYFDWCKRNIPTLKKYLLGMI